MKLGILKAMFESASDDAEIKIENGEIVITEPQQIDFRFNVGDKVTTDVDPDTVYIITKRFVEDGKPIYLLKFDHGHSMECEEDSVKFCVSKDITERIKRFEDAVNCSQVENGEIATAEPQQIEFRFKVGDKVRDVNNPELIYTVIGQFAENGKPFYDLKGTWGEALSAESWLISVSRDITERIKSFDDACKWCVENGKREMIHTYSLIFNDLLNSESEITEDVDDIIAYLQLRIITAALNEGWEPTFEDEEERWHVEYDVTEGGYESECSSCWEEVPNKLLFKSEKLANYTAVQFKDNYAGFCGKKGGNQ